eukprot:TRINITY_DN9788_c0_g1_i1.p1 TRINITY_DN9788_c0_g1~~TRINITY_DN9788_c0_g1_i1.p1  ORF type:complete len:273 (+),score=45.09 TRINITY_DN9788_c0_g1_i1:262-1080(+)
MYLFCLFVLCTVTGSLYHNGGCAAAVLRREIYPVFDAEVTNFYEKPLVLPNRGIDFLRVSEEQKSILQFNLSDIYSEFTSRYMLNNLVDDIIYAELHLTAKDVTSFGEQRARKLISGSEAFDSDVMGDDNDLFKDSKFNLDVSDELLWSWRPLSPSHKVVFPVTQLIKEAAFQDDQLFSLLIEANTHDGAEVFYWSSSAEVAVKPLIYIEVSVTREEAWDSEKEPSPSSAENNKDCNKKLHMTDIRFLLHVTIIGTIAVFIFVFTLLYILKH